MKKKKLANSLREILVTIGKYPFHFWILGILFLFLFFLPGQNYYETLQIDYQKPLIRPAVLGDFVPSMYPQKVGPENSPTISAESAIVSDLESGVILFSLNPRQHLRPASITKLMTALVALEYYQPEQILTVQRLPVTKGESEMGLAVGDKVSVRNLIYGLLVPSGNDAAYTLADNYAGGIENFIYSMNKKAEALHMQDTHFDNPSGLDSDNHYSGARDISLLAEAALKNKFISDVVATYGITLADAAGKKFYPMKNVNQFLGYLYGADGVKTGFTDLAGECLVATVTRNNHRVLSVVLKSNDRFSDSAQLQEWVFRNFEWRNPNANQN